VTRVLTIAEDLARIRSIMKAGVLPLGWQRIAREWAVADSDPTLGPSAWRAIKDAAGLGESVLAGTNVAPTEAPPPGTPRLD
jgi:hypothetical protein